MQQHPVMPVSLSRTSLYSSPPPSPPTVLLHPHHNPPSHPNRYRPADRARSRPRCPRPRSHLRGRGPTGRPRGYLHRRPRSPRLLPLWHGMARGLWLSSASTIPGPEVKCGISIALRYDTTRDDTTRTWTHLLTTLRNLWKKFGLPEASGAGCVAAAMENTASSG